MRYFQINRAPMGAQFSIPVELSLRQPFVNHRPGAGYRLPCHLLASGQEGRLFAKDSRHWRDNVDPSSRSIYILSGTVSECEYSGSTISSFDFLSSGVARSQQNSRKQCHTGVRFIFRGKINAKNLFHFVVGLVACSGISEEEVDQNINIVLNAIESKISNSEALEVICFGYEKSEVDVQGCYDFNIGIHYRIGETSSTQKELKEVYGITRCESAPDKYLLGKITYSSKDIKISCNMALAK